MKKEEINDEIMNLNKGDENDRKIAFKCIGILSNESTTESFESRLEIVSKIIEDYKKKK